MSSRNDWSDKFTECTTYVNKRTISTKNQRCSLRITSRPENSRPRQDQRQQPLTATRTLLTAPSSVCLNLLEHAVTFDPKYVCIQPSVKKHQCWRFGEMQSSNFQDIALTRQECWRPCDLELWPFEPTSWSIHPCPKMRQYWKFGENKSICFQDIVLTTLKMHRQTYTNSANT